MSSRGSPPIKQAAGLADPARKLAERFDHSLPPPAVASKYQRKAWRPSGSHFSSRAASRRDQGQRRAK